MSISNQAPASPVAVELESGSMVYRPEMVEKIHKATRNLWALLATRAPNSFIWERALYVLESLERELGRGRTI